jgi:hypothetical protein
MLYHGNNLTAGANGLKYNGIHYSLVNYFIPHTEDEVGSTGRFESNFMNQYLASRKISSKAQAVLDAGGSFPTSCLSAQKIFSNPCKRVFNTVHKCPIL